MEILGSSLSVPNVQELAKGNISTVPERYIHPDQDPISVSNTSLLSSIPVINFQSLLHGETAQSERERLHHACKDWGFFQLVNHDVSANIIEKMKEELRRFFDSPFEKKKKLSQISGEVEGYGQIFVVSEDQKLDWADMLYLVTLPVYLRKPHIWQMLSPSFRSTIENYAIETRNLAMTLLELMADNLGMKKEEIYKIFDDGMQAMRMNYYPPCPQPESVIGLSPHSDATALITFLLQASDVQGLQIRKDGAWLPVSPLPNALVVNIGDIMEIISNGAYRSIEHRAVVSHDKERLSIATFLSPNVSEEVGPAHSLLTPQNPPLFRRLEAKEYFKGFFARKLQGKSYIDDLRIEQHDLAVPEK